MSNSETLLFRSEKNNNVRPTEAAADSDQQVVDHVDQEERVGDNFEEERCKNNCVIVVSSSSLEIKLVDELLLFKNSNNTTKEDEDEDEEGLRTPTSLDQRIPLILKCPPAPMKPMSLPSMRRKTLLSRRRIILDCSDEIQLFFGQNLTRDHRDFGADYNKFKKQCNAKEKARELLNSS